MSFGMAHACGICTKAPIKMALASGSTLRPDKKAYILGPPKSRGLKIIFYKL